MTTQTSSWKRHEEFEDYILWSRCTASGCIYQITFNLGPNTAPPVHYAGYVDKNWLLRSKGLL